MNRVTKQLAASVLALGFVAAPASFAGTYSSPAVYNAPGANVSQNQSERPQPSWAPGHYSNIHTTSTYTYYLYLKKGGK